MYHHRVDPALSSKKKGLTNPPAATVFFVTVLSICFQFSGTFSDYGVQ